MPHDRSRVREAILAFAALLLMLFANGRWSFVPAAWLGPLLLVRFMRTAPLRRALAGGCIILTAASFVWWRDVFPLRGAAYVAAAFVLGSVTLIPYLLDRRYAARLGGIAGTLVLPCSAVAFETLNVFASPFGSWGAYAYAQAGFLPLMQLASITGLAGITFLVLWLAAAQHKRRAFVSCIAVIAAVLLFGALRMRGAHEANVRVAAITPRVPTYTRERMAAARDPRVRNAINDELLAASDVEADVVVWSEGAGITTPEDEAGLIAKAANVARRRHAWIELAYLVLTKDAYENKAVLVDAAGATVWTYRKTNPVPLMEACAPGDGRVPVAPTPFGRLATVICFDGDFPRLVRNSAGVDILLIPADDWRAIAPLHARMARFRAVEQGLSIVRATSNGSSTVVDRYGRVLAQTSYFDGSRLLRANVPRAGGATVYSRIGELPALAAVLLLIVLIAIAESRSLLNASPRAAASERLPHAP